MNRDVCEHFNPVDLPCDKCNVVALRLARELEACPTINYKDHAAELRRLHGDVMVLQRKLSEMEQTEQKPFAWMSVGGSIWRHKGRDDDVPLYSNPPRREWRGLTEEEIMGMTRTECIDMRWPSTALNIARAIEQALKEKNQ